MTAEHFKEVLETVMLSTRSRKRDIANYLYVSKVSLNNWCKKGVPPNRSVRVMTELRLYLFSNLGGC